MVTSKSREAVFPKVEYCCSSRMPPGERVIACEDFLLFSWQITLNTGAFSLPEGVSAYPFCALTLRVTAPWSLLTCTACPMAAGAQKARKIVTASDSALVVFILSLGGYRAPCGRRTLQDSALSNLLRQKHVLARELLKYRRLLSKVGGENVARISGDPLRQINALVVAVVKDDEDARFPASYVLDRVSKALRDVTDVALPQFFFAPAPLRAEQGHVEFAAQNVLPFGRIRMPMQFPQRASLHLQHHSGHGRGNRELRAIHAPLQTTAEGLKGLLGKQAVLVRERRPLPALQRRSGNRRWNFALGEVNLFLREAIEGGGGHAEILGKQFPRSMADPVRDAEGTKLREVAVVENQNEVARLVAQRLDDMTMTARKIPDVARPKIIRLGTALRIDNGGAHRTLGDKRPLRGGGVPVQFAHDARLHAHRNSCDPFGYRQLGHSRFFAVAAAHHPAF